MPRVGKTFRQVPYTTSSGEPGVRSENFKISDTDIKSPIGGSILGLNYLGPGNTSRVDGNTREPVNRADAIAADHDDNYSLAKNQQDIRDADSSAIKSFGLEALKGDYLSAVGAIGLGAKTLVERALNTTLYPHLGKLWHRFEEQIIGGDTN